MPSITTMKDILSTPSAPPPPRAFDTPLHKLPAVRNAIASAWTSVANGNARNEASFVVHGLKPDGSPIIRQSPGSQDYSKETFDIAPGDKAIFHSHPNVMDPKPSDADRKIADKHGVDIYTITRGGLYRYSKGMKQPELVESSLDFLNDKSGAPTTANAVLAGK